MIKAKTICEMTGELVLADDSGLEIDALNGEPGVYSARYMGEETSYHIKNANLVQRLEGVADEKRTARFVCAMAAAFPDGKTITTRGTIEGRIGYEERGENGFGYDPIFYLPEYGCSTAELSLEKKNEIFPQRSGRGAWSPPRHLYDGRKQLCCSPVLLLPGLKRLSAFWHRESRDFFPSALQK